MNSSEINNAIPVTIQKHKDILEKRGLLGLGYSVTSAKENAKYISLAVLSIISIIFIPIAIPLICLHYKKIGAKVLEDDRINSIRNKCLFQPSAGELNYFKRLEIFKKNEHFDDTDENILKIQNAHRNYELANALTTDDNFLNKYLKTSNLSATDHQSLTTNANKIKSSSITLEIDDSFEKLAKLNEVISAIPDFDEKSTTDFLNIITDQGKDAVNLTDSKLDQFEIISETYSTLKTAGFEQALESSTHLLSYILRLYEVGKPEIAKKLVKTFNEHSYIRNTIIQTPLKFHEFFNSEIFNRIETLDSEENINTAILNFRAAFNRPEENRKIMEEQYGKDNVAIFEEVYREQAPEIIDGAINLEDHVSSKPYIEQIRESILNIASNLELDFKTVEIHLITEDLTPEIFDKKMKQLRTLSAFAKKEMHHNNEARKEFALEFLALLGNDLFENFKFENYRTGLKDISNYAEKMVMDKKYPPKDVAYGISRVIKNRISCEGIDHKSSFSHIAHACDTFAIFDRSRRESIRHEIDDEVFVIIYSKNHSAETIEQKISDLSKYLKLPSLLVEKTLKGSVNGILPQDKINNLIKLSVTKKTLINDKKNRVIATSEFLLAFDAKQIIEFSSNNESLEKMRALIDYSVEIHSKKVYPLSVIIKGLHNTFDILSKDEGMNAQKSLKYVFEAAKSRIDNQQDETVKKILQKEMLKFEVTSRLNLKDRDSINFAVMLLDSFTVKKTLPKKSSLKFIAEAIQFCMDLKVNNKASDSSIASAFFSENTICNLFDISKLDKQTNPQFSQISKDSIEKNATKKDEAFNKIEMTDEEKYFPILFKLLPLVVEEVIPNVNKKLAADIHKELEKIMTSFNESPALQNELKVSVKNAKVVNSTFSYPDVFLNGIIDSVYKLAESDIKDSIQTINALEDDITDFISIENSLIEAKTTQVTKNIMPIAIELFSNIHEIYNQIQEIKNQGLEPRIVLEGSNVPVSEKPNVVIVSLKEKLLLDFFEELPRDDSFNIKILENIPNLLNGAFGGITNFIAKKKAKKLIISLLKEQGLPANHVKFINDNLDSLITLGLKLVPVLLTKHDVPGYVNKLNAIKNIVSQKGDLNIKDLSLELLNFSLDIHGDALTYKPLILNFIQAMKTLFKEES